MIKRLILPLVAALSILLVAQQDAHAFDPQRKPDKWAYQQGVINPEYLNLRRGLVGHWAVWEEGGPPHNLVPIARGEETLNGSTWTATSMGPGINSNGTASSYTTMGNDARLRPGSAYTFAVWMQTSDNDGYIWSFTDNPWQHLYVLAGGTVRFTVTTSGATDMDGSVTVNDGVPHHVVGVYDGSDMLLYIDGKLDTSTAKTGTAGYNAGASRWGFNVADLLPLDITIIEGRIYDRGLSAIEVKMLYQYPFIDLYPAPELQAAAEQAAAATPQVIVIGWEVPRWATRWMWWL